MSYYEEAPHIIKPLDLRDAGTREQHCMELLEIWETGLMILRARRHRLVTDRDKQMVLELEAATGLLKKHLLTTAGGFREMFYLREINSVKTGEVKDGQS